jgi:hypothetical protein
MILGIMRILTRIRLAIHAYGRGDVVLYGVRTIVLNGSAYFWIEATRAGRMRTPALLGAPLIQSVCPNDSTK